ncbi:IS3 family transposase [Paenibacillus chibensis]
MNRQTFVSSKQRNDEAMKLKIVECYEKLKGIYGYRRVKIWLKRTHAVHMNHKRVQRLMGELGLRAVIRRKRPYYGKKEAYVISNNQSWCSIRLKRRGNGGIPKCSLAQ